MLMLILMLMLMPPYSSHTLPSSSAGPRLVTVVVLAGAKAIMIPGYYYVELLHVYFALYSWLSPNSLAAIVKTYYCVNIFTFVRVYIKVSTARCSVRSPSWVVRLDWLDLAETTMYDISQLDSNLG